MALNLAEKAAALDRYDLDLYMLPYWKGDLICNETLFFYENGRGVASAPLLFNANKILRVCSADLQTVYEEGVDYTYQNGVITAVKGGRIPVYSYDWMYPSGFSNDPPAMCCHLYQNHTETDRFTRYYYGAVGQEHFVYVSYLHDDGWTGEVPEYQGDRLPRTVEKLRHHEKVRAVVYGDSAFHADESSGQVNRPPFMPAWGAMGLAMAEKLWGTEIEYLNYSVGGWSSEQGLNGGYQCYEQKDVPGAAGRVAPQKPDLVILGFGQNDRCDPAHFIDNMRGIMDAFRKENPAVEFIVYTPYMPNPDVSFGDEETGRFFDGQYRYPRVLTALAAESGAALVPMHLYQWPLLMRKRSVDLFANNINHPSDFFYRLFAQALCKALCPDYDK